MADEVTQPNATPPPATPPAAAPPPQENTEVVKQLTQATEQLTQAQAKIAGLEKQLSGLTSGNQQANEKLTTIQQQYAEADKLLKQREGELANLNTQLEQHLGKVNELTGLNSNLAKQAELFNLIAATPEYHGLVGAFTKLSEVIKPDASADAIKAVMDAMAKESKAQMTQALEIFRAGGSPQANHGGNPGPQGPKNKEEAWQNWQKALRSGNQAQQQEAYRQFNELVSAENNRQQA